MLAWAVLCASGTDVPIDNYEGGNVLGRIEVFVATRHDEANDALKPDADCKGLAGTQPVTRKSTGDRAGDIEQVDHRIPAEALPQRIFIAEDDGEPRGGVGAEGVCGEVIHEPDERNDSQALPIESACD